MRQAGKFSRGQARGVPVWRHPLTCTKFPLRNQRGVTYVVLMFSLFLIGLSLSVAAKQWKMVVQRDKEADLLAKGIEIQNALALYSATTKAGRVMPGEFYPQSLADLVKPPKPFLRKVYPDPITGGEWDYIRAPTGGIMGVRSRSKATPIKEKGFPPEIRHFEGLSRYQDWIFQHPSPSAPQQPLGGVPPQPGQPANPAAPAPASP